ncbi:MAG TPA: hypothetical protein VMV10_11145 [Pirellulales bacterium]|nr:hypothetical protein [Pirellulales bacterium]
MIARNLAVAAPASPGWPRFGLTALIAAHVAADVLIAHATRSSLGFQGFWVYPFLAGGVTCGQAVLLAQFVFLARGRASLRMLLVAGWFALLYYLASPIFRSVAGPGAANYQNMAFVGVPFVLSALLPLAHCVLGRRIEPRDASPSLVEREAFQFSLGQIFSLTLAAAIVLAVVRFARETISVPSEVIWYFGIFPLLHAFVLLPLLSPWAALGAKHPGWRCLALVLMAIVCGVGPAFIGKATAPVYGMVAGPLVLQSLVVTGTLLVARWIGYRFVSGEPIESSTRIHRPPPRL